MKKIASSSVDPEMLLSRLSFSHLTLLLPLHEPEKRAFYERQCMKSNWSVAELKRQINTLYFEQALVDNLEAFLIANML
jgi:predicted nuclease of restriction endonuclease-like (RecB) superfamily